MKHRLAAIIGLCLFLLPALSRAAADLEDVEELLRIAPTRNMGSPYRQALDDYVAERFRATKCEWGEIVFPTPVYVPGRAELRLEDGKPITLYGMAPNIVEPGNLPEGHWSGMLADIGHGEVEQMRGVSLRGAAVLLDMESHRQWMSVVELGAKVLIFVGGKFDSGREGAMKLAASPIAVPRFYLPYGDGLKLRKALGGRRSAPASIVQTQLGRWEMAKARNQWVIVPGGEHADKVVHIMAYKDAASFAPELTPGADSAANLALLLRLLDRYVARKPQCTLVFAAISDHCNGLRGEQFYMGHVFTEPKAFEEEMEQRRRDLAQARFYASVYSRTSPEDIAALREGASFESGQRLMLKTPLVQELDYRRNKLRYEKYQLTTQLRRPDLPESERARIRATTEQNDRDLADYNAMRGVLQRYGGGSEFTQLTKAQQAAFLELMRDTQRRFAQKVEDWEAELRQIEENGRLRKLLEGKAPLLCLSLDLTFGNERMGLFFSGGDQRFADASWEHTVTALADLAVRIASGIEGGTRYFADTIRKAGGVDWRHHLPDKFPLAASIAHSAVVPGVTMTTIGDTRDVHFTPHNTLANADRGRMSSMLAFAQRMIEAILDHRDFPGAVRPHRARNYRCMTLRHNIRLLDPFSVEVPSEPAQNALAVLWSAYVLTDLPTVVGQVSIYELAGVDRQGAALYRAVPHPLAIEAYGFDADYRRIVAAIDAGAAARRFNPMPATTANRWTWADHIAVIFNCAQTDLVGFLPYDPTTLQPQDFITVLDAIRESSPDHYGIAGILEMRSARFKPRPARDGTACIFSEAGLPIKVLYDRWLLINATKSKPAGAGFNPGAPELRSINYTAAKDLQVLNGLRLERLLSRGVTNNAAVQLYREAEQLLAQAQKALDAGDEPTFRTAASEALHTAFRSYKMVRTTTSDLIKAVAAFLALIIPFCLFLMKLITPWTDIRAQIGAFLGIFAAMSLGLALLHPAFGLSQTPMIVLLAFVMIGLAVFVMVILHNRFDSGLRRLVEESQGVSSSESSRSMLAGVAFSVGVNNMRRRRIRTTLTSATIVLVTFTMLSVISVGVSVTPYRRRTVESAPYNGVLFAKAGMAPITDLEAEVVTSRLRPHGLVVRRTWTQRLDAYGGYMPLVISPADGAGQSVQIKALLGLERAEDGFLGPIPLVAGRWLSSKDAAEIILSAEAGAHLGIRREGFAPREVSLLGRRAVVVGLVDDAKIAALQDMVRLPFLPLESLPDPVTRAVAETGAMNVSAEDAAKGPAPTPIALQPSQCALVPVDFAMSLPGTSLRTLALKTQDPAEAWKAANHLVNSTGVLTYAGLRGDVAVDETTTIRAGQYSLGVPVGTGVGGASKVVIPICLAATIILNTMLGSVMERKKEIAIYNSIGLNPTHVFVFFVAEALVFGLIGSVAGYLIGQALALAIAKLNLLPGINLNYSSMAVMVVIFASMLTVIVSTLYPAYVATRASVPSGQRRWKLPPPKGDELSLDFPFCYSERQLLGVCAFLHQFMDLNSEASSGQFLAQDAHFGFVRDAEGRRVLAMTYNITPVPFDLGVNERMEIYGYYQPRVRNYMLAVYLTRTKGDKTSWLVVNQPFMESLRARLLSWRSQTPEHQEQFCKMGERLFAGAPEFPVREVSA